jgi:hypothetical protein
MIFRSITEAQRERESLYSNGHFVWQITDATGPKETTTRHEYWAKDGKLFRLDQYNWTNGKIDGDIERLILSPQGMTRIYAKSRSDVGNIASSTNTDICKDGSCPPSLDGISGQFFVAHGNRWASLQVKGLLERWSKRDYDLTQLEVTQNDSNACVLSFQRDRLEGIQNGIVVMDPETYRVRSWSYKFKGKDGERVARQESVFVYSSGNADIPSEEHSVATSNFQPIDSRHVKLVEYDLKPAELDRFLLPTELTLPVSGGNTSSD